MVILFCYNLYRRIERYFIMEQMIQVINDNLTSVMNGIKTHREVTEKSLLEIKTEMDEKLSIASEYRQNVEDARNIISNLEIEITGLDADLKELKEKFDEKDFKEILTAGNKAISAKIIKKRALINEQSGRILELTKKAHALKNELIRLRDQKMSIEETLEKDLTLENYYGSRIQSIIEFTEEHPNELKDYVEIPESELLASPNEYERVDIKKIVDGSIFEEIDEISSHAPEMDENMIKEVLVNSENLPVEEEEENESPDLSMTQQLDDLIFQANDLIEKSKQTDLPPLEELEEQEPLREENMEEKREEVKEEIVESIEVSIPDEIQETIDESHVITPELENKEKPQDDFNDAIDEAKMLDALSAFSLEDVDASISLEEVEDYDADEEEALELIMENDRDLATIENLASIYDEDVASSEIEGVNADDLKALDDSLQGIVDATMFNDENLDLDSRLAACNLDKERFHEEDWIKLEKLDKNATKDFIEVMKKHNIAVSRIYENVDVLLQVTPKDLERILTLLEKTNANSNSISYVFDALNKVNVSLLESEINANSERELGEILAAILPNSEESDVIKRLGLNAKEEEVLRKSATEEEWKIIHLFPEIVIANYNELKKYEVENLNECFTRHPHRFTLNPDHFAEILDKYDPEDLTRCVNKNAAVIDRL